VSARGARHSTKRKRFQSKEDRLAAAGTRANFQSALRDLLEVEIDGKDLGGLLERLTQTLRSAAGSRDREIPDGLHGCKITLGDLRDLKNLLLTLHDLSAYRPPFDHHTVVRSAQPSHRKAAP
jgi:hypothetical protein